MYEGDGPLGNAFCIQDGEVCCVGGCPVDHGQNPAIILTLRILARHKDGLLAQKHHSKAPQHHRTSYLFRQQPSANQGMNAWLIILSARRTGAPTHLSKAVAARTPRLLLDCTAVPRCGAVVEPPVQRSCHFQHHLPHTRTCSSATTLMLKPSSPLLAHRCLRYLCTSFFGT